MDCFHENLISRNNSSFTFDILLFNIFGVFGVFMHVKTEASFINKYQHSYAH